MNKIVYKLVYNRKKRLNKQGLALVQVEAYLKNVVNPLLEENKDLLGVKAEIQV